MGEGFINQNEGEAIMAQHKRLIVKTLARSFEAWLREQFEGGLPDFVHMDIEMTKERQDDFIGHVDLCKTDFNFATERKKLESAIAQYELWPWPRPRVYSTGLPLCQRTRRAET